jgi:hypothetical protein
MHRTAAEAAAFVNNVICCITFTDAQLPAVFRHASYTNIIS